MLPGKNKSIPLRLSPLAAAVIQAGCILAAGAMLLAAISLKAAPTGNYHQLITIHRAAMTAAPECLVTGCLTGLLIDLIQRRRG